MTIFPLQLYAQISNVKEYNTDTLQQQGSSKFFHSLGVEFRPAYLIPNAPFFNGDNNQAKPIRNIFSGHVRYAFRLPENSLGNQVYNNTFQGIGLSYYNFGNKAEVGNPVALYLFQRSPIKQWNSKLSLNYEWNFGVSAGWKPYNFYLNPKNIVVGSKVNAYVNSGIYLKWKTANAISFTAGADISHFSNGNTDFPNAGVNMTGLKLGIDYEFGQTSKVRLPSTKNNFINRPFPKHISYDVVVFGSWRRKGVVFLESQVASPDKYPVLGAYVAPMYNFGYRFRAGVSVDMLYDGSANVYTKDYISGTEQEFFKPPLNRQLALGLSARAEYVMPVFTIGLGLGANVLHKGGDLNGTYQALALKVKASHNTFLHVGYSLKDFHEPNFLMLGLGFRLNNKRPPLLGE